MAVLGLSLLILVSNLFNYWNNEFGKNIYSALFWIFKCVISKFLSPIKYVLLYESVPYREATELWISKFNENLIETYQPVPTLEFEVF